MRFLKLSGLLRRLDAIVDAGEMEAVVVVVVEPLHAAAPGS